ncbi:RNA polymerase sigma factor [Sphingobacterium griseoflavum]|uniref:RNA polymerase sigma-70 factor n=1 Tax=Sphingobacterium griseoflavum TaxID=1474952 RepID=A0ABQ3HXU0_9SPHI|nr:sigma-70 family RNA polymerase sigma factor [Sphingobacterium griseoflavum]GHE45475.1 RNA polymerase sigma-70 factor [Sphingobacterium griseoflavum]
MAASAWCDKSKIVQRVKRGDEAAFRLLYTAYFDQVAREIYFVLKDRALTEEVVQDVFYKIWQNRDQLDTIVNLEGYLRILSRNAALNLLKANLRRRTMEHGYYRERVDLLDDTSESDQQNEYYRLLDRAIEKLPPQQKRVYQLSRFERMKYLEIAAHLNLSKESVKSYLKLATQAIKKYLTYHKDSIVCFFFILSSF